MESDELRARLSRADPGALAGFLARLADEDEALRERIETLAAREAPSEYAAALERRLKRLRGGRAFIAYAESAAFARELDAWLDDVEAGLLASDPQSAWKLVDRFIRGDARIIERADDSDGAIGDVFRRACALWHRTAAALPADAAWVDRVHELHAGNGYGTRDAILDEAGTLLSPLELRRLAAIYEQEARAELKSEDRFPALTAATAMGQVARALGDAALYERSVRLYSARPNSLQAENIAAQYLRFGPVERAVEWLTRPEDRQQGHRERLDLLAQAYEKLGQTELLLDARRRLAEEALSADSFRRYEALLPAGERDGARREAVDRACRSREPVKAALFLSELAELDRAAALVLRQREQLAASFYGELIELADRLEKSGHALAAIACYRALIEQILDAGRSKAYRYAKRYVDRLAALHASVADPAELGGHAEYLVHLRSVHGRKRGFWSLLGKA
jgi:hypothetical protein